jgi:hypothetical protein
VVELEEVSLPEYHRGPGIISWMEGPRGKWLHRWARCALTTTREGVCTSLQIQNLACE